MALWNYLRAGGKRAFAVWHRRAGKDEICLHHAAWAAMERPANYGHVLPEFSAGPQGYLDRRQSAHRQAAHRRGVPGRDRREPQRHVDDDPIHQRHTWAVLGSDTYDTSLVGSSYAGLTFSEFALSNPSVWAYARPMLEENDGWAIFITTPRGRNHAFEMFKFAAKNPAGFANY